ncbi:MAG: lysylphosphatidylglycerol synthase transmembrane domain-containing protein [Nanoarchaeota archaeon]|nr:flippase-like domain-containing protein [Nanoarchaeota archaeon]MBU1030442.1 flippase-like domain-containing protein [Nanoarchaeota archaeon]MBU1849775.1 flippase-like domain-containing protein [Nanoarchaeota archaeon]
MKKKLLILGSIVIGIIAFLLILKSVPLNEVWTSLKNAKPQHVIGYIIVSIGIMSAHTWRWKIVTSTQKLNIPFQKLLAYRIVGYGVSYLTPSAKLGGEPVRAALLTKHDLEFHEALSSVIIDKTIDIAACAVFFFIGVITLLFQFALPHETETLLLVFAIVFLTLMILLYKRLTSGNSIVEPICKVLGLTKLKGFQKSKQKIRSFEDLLVKFFKEDKTDFLITIVISGLTWILMFLEYKFVGLMLGINLPFIAIFLIVCFVGVAFVVPIPMAVGSLEASQLIAFSIAGLKTTSGLGLSLIVRVRDLLWSLLGIILLSYYGLNIKSTMKKLYNNSEKTEK